MTENNPEPKNKGGRPLKFKTVKELKEKIDAYFKSCFKPVMDKVLVPEAKHLKREEITEDHYKWVQRKDWEGNPVIEQVEPFTITGLALSLGVDRLTLINYGKKEEFFNTIKEAKTMIENYAEKALYRDKNVTGVIFNLKNNYEWKDKTETDHTTKGDKIIPILGGATNV